MKSPGGIASQSVVDESVTTTVLTSTIKITRTITKTLLKAGQSTSASSMSGASSIGIASQTSSGSVAVFNGAAGTTAAQMMTVALLPILVAALFL